MLGIVMLSYHQWEEPPEYEGISESLFQLYRLRTAQCLSIGDIAKCLPYTIEALRFNATAELNRQDDNSRGLWIITGVIVRAAINMGYHRDPSQLQSPSLSILQSEYRRRVWNSVMQMDDLNSFLVGFPRMMAAIYSDTKEPRNIHDWELSEETTVLPPSRPLTEPTSSTYVIVKGRIAHALGRVTDFNNLPGLGSYDTVLNLDKALYEAYQNIPSHMKVFDDKGELNSYNSQSGIAGMQLESLYHKGMCTLHRGFIAKARLDPRYKLSRDRCLSSALAILDFQYLLESSWYKFSGVRHMIAFAAMILFLELEHGRRGPDLNSTPFDGATLLHALEKSCKLWSEAKRSCEEAYRVYHILTGMLSSFQTPSTSNHSGSPDPPFDFPGLSPQFQPGSVEKDMFRLLNDEADIDWVRLALASFTRVIKC
jgi:Fungal specific transcription factor domain